MSDTDTVTINDVIFTLPELETDVWRLLVRAGADRKDGFRTASLGSVAPDGTPRLRTLVLRQADAARKYLYAYADRRTPKIGELTQQPAVGWLFWDDRRSLQFRLRGTATVHTDGDPVAAEHWERTAPPGRKDYLAEQPPGTPLPHPSQGLPDGVEGEAPPLDLTERVGRPHFAVIRTRVTEIDWLYLSRDGHRRARFVYAAGKLSEATWLVP